MKKIVEIKGEYSDIFGVVFSAELIETLYNVYGFREEYRKLREKCSCSYIFLSIYNDNLECWKYRLD